MGYTIQDVNSCTKKFSFVFESLEISKEINNALQKKKKEANT